MPFHWEKMRVKVQLRVIERERERRNLGMFFNILSKNVGFKYNCANSQHVSL